MHQHALSNDNHNVQKQNNPSTTQSQSTIQAKQKPVQAKQKPIQAKQKPIQSKQRPVQAKQRPVQRNTTGQTKGEQPQGSAKFKEIATTMGQQHGVDTSQLKATHNSSFPDTVNAEATIQGNKIDFAPGKDTEANMKHEVAHAIDNVKNGTPKGDKVVNGQSVDTTREQTVDNMAAQPLQRKENQSTENLGQQEVISSGGPVQRANDDLRKVQRVVDMLESNPNIQRIDYGDIIYYNTRMGVNGGKKTIARLQNNKVYFNYPGFKNDIVIEDDSIPVVILGKFAPDWNNPNSPGVRMLLGGVLGDGQEVSGLPEGFVGHVRGGTKEQFEEGDEPIKALSLPESYFESTVNKNISEVAAENTGQSIPLDALSTPEIKVKLLVELYNMDQGEATELVNNEPERARREQTFRVLGNIAPAQKDNRLTVIEGYIAEGQRRGDQEVWDEKNLPFLENAFKSGAIIRLISHPVRQKTGFYAREIDAIFGKTRGKFILGLAKKHGYKYDKNTGTLNPMW